MLDERQRRRIADRFAVYDHDWSFYVNFLGEPFLLQDELLAYHDGAFLFVCAFSLADVWREFDWPELTRMIESEPRLARRPVKALDVWGRCLSPAESWTVFGRTYRTVKSFEDSTSTDSSLVVDAGGMHASAALRLALNAARNAGFETQVLAREYLSAEHLTLIHEFIEKHDVAATHVAMILSVRAFTARSNVVLIEVRSHDVLKGFGVLSRISSGAAVLTWAFHARERGNRSGDAMMGAAIEYCAAAGIQRLHLGYSPNDGVHRFKQKWRAQFNYPAYREAFFSEDDRAAQTFATGWFLWSERLLYGSMTGGASES